MSKEEIIRASAGPIATGGGSKSPNALDTAAIKRLEERLRGIPPRNYLQRKEISNKITEIKEKTL